MIHLYTTRRFSAYCIKSEFISNESVDSLLVENLSVNIDSFVKRVQCNGFSILRIDGIISKETRFMAVSAISRMVAYLTSRYDATEDSFDDLDMQAYEIVRIPRIGNGKHNVHFDPQFSKQHGALQQLATEAGFAQLLSVYMGKQCSLRETGISVTRPMLMDHQISTSSSSSSGGSGGGGSSSSGFTGPTYIPGEGMEWHSDGSRGEATVLMTLEDIDATMGSLHVIPGSHHEYIDGVGHEEVYTHTYIHT